MKQSFAILLLAIAVSCTQTSKESVQTEEEKEQNQSFAELGSPDRPIKLQLTPSIDPQSVQAAGQTLVDFLEKETGYAFELESSANYQDLIDGFGRDEVHVALMNSFSYVKANERYGATARLWAVRYGKSTYQGQIIVDASKDINTIADLNNKSVAYTDSASASGYLLPAQMIAEVNAIPALTAFIGRHDEVARLVYSGKYDAGATFYSEPSKEGMPRDARAMLVEEFPDIFEKVKILAVTPYIPNDPVVFANEMSTAMIRTISIGLIKYMREYDGEGSLKSLYSIEGYARCSDSDYDVLRPLTGF